MSNLLRVTGSVVNVRVGPSASAEAWTQVKAGSLIEARPVASEGPWLAVWTPQGKPGWIHGAYVTAASPAPAPSLSPSPSRKPKWRVAKSLDVLLAQIDTRAQKRNKKYDGSIGDEEHQKDVSDHNPDKNNVVRARDYTHDAKAGADMAAITEALRKSRDPRISYVIFNRRIFKAYVDKAGVPAWQWQTYRRKNPHTLHAHVSVVATPAVYDDVRPWLI